METVCKICSMCGESKPLSTKFFTRKFNTKNGIKTPYWYGFCKICQKSKDRVSQKDYYDKNKESILQKKKLRYVKNKRKNKEEVDRKIKERNDRIWSEESPENKVKSRKKRRKEKKKEYYKKYYLDNKAKKLEQARINHARRLKEDPVYRLRSIVSTSIGRALKKSFSSKNGSSILKHLPYTIQELKDYLENLFEFWMTWENYGTYRVDIWDDNDPTTWTWHLDHIIPHSKFQYTTMEEPAFKDCWALSNLRPYSAKQNIIDGNRQ